MTDTNETGTFGLQSGYLLGEVVGILLAVAVAVWVTISIDWTPVRALSALVLLCFLPGYALLTVLFPRRRVRTRYGELDQFAPGFSTGERFWCSIGLSLAVDPFIGLGLWAIDPQGFDVYVLLGVLGAFVGLTTLYGGVKRRRIDPADRYRLRLFEWVGVSLDTPPVGGTVGRTLNVLVVCSLLVAVGALGGGLVSPHDGETYTTVELLTESSDGLALVANSSEIDAGEPVTISLTNQEDRSVTYTVVVVTEQTRYNGTAVVDERARLRTSVPDGSTRQLTHTVQPPGPAADRIRFLVYRGPPPESPSPANAYRSVYIWFEPTSAHVRTPSLSP